MTRLCVALDVGVATTRIAVHGTRSRLMTSVTPRGTMRDNVCAGLRMAPRPANEICVAVPDTWLSGSVGEAGLLEDIRHACEGELGMTRVILVGQLAAVAASCARQRDPGRYLVCDIGYSGVRAGSFTVTGSTVRTDMAIGQDGGGWSEFDRTVRAIVGGDPLPEDWYVQALAESDRAAEVFENAAASPDHWDDRAYRLAGRREHRITARQMMDCFAPVRERMAAAVTAAIDVGPPGTVVLTGGLGWFPLARFLLRDMTGLEAMVTGPDEAVRGALGLARGEASVAQPAGLGVVSLPMHRVEAGLLGEKSLEIPWTEAFAGPPDEMISLDQEELVLMINGEYRTFRLPGLIPGSYQIGVRPGWSGSGVLVVRSAAGDVTHIVSLGTVDSP
jgi:hypothetical protein